MPHSQKSLILLFIVAIFFSANVINTSSFKFSTRRFSLKLKKPFRLSATDNESPSEKPKKKTANVDLFAAGERKPIAPPAPIVFVSVTQSSDKAVDAVKPVKAEEKVASASTTEVKTAAPIVSAPSASSARNSMIELQAELLRLQAEKEQLEIDQLRIDEEKSRLDSIDALILQLIDSEITLEQLVTSKKNLVRKELFFRLAELANAGATPEEKMRFTTLCDDLMECMLRLDGNLHAELNADIQKELNMELNRAKTSQKEKKDNDIVKAVNRDKEFDDALSQWQQQIAGNSSRIQVGPFGQMPVLLPGMNASTVMPNGMGRAMIRFPAAVPINLLPFMLRSPEISQEDLAVLKEKIFTPDVIGSVIVDYSTFLATFRGQPNVSTIDTYERAKQRMAEIPGMSDRLRLFLLPEYRLQGIETKNEQTEKYSGSKFEPVFTVLSRQAAPREKAGNTELAFGFGCLVATLATCFIYGTDVNSLNEGFVAKAMEAATGSGEGAVVTAEALAAGREVVGRLLPVAFGLLGLQVAHDMGHAAAAKAHNTQISLPYFLPSLQVGTFGSITNFLQFPKSRKALFDIAIAGPAVGFLFSLGATLYGLSLTAGASPEALATFPALPTGFFSSSFLLHELVQGFLHISTVAPPALTPVHPLVAIGMTGLLANALNFMPIGRLDGGRVAMAIGGRQSADQIAFITLIGQAVSIFSDASPIYFFWIVLVVFLQRGADIPPENDVTPVATEEEDKKKGPKWIARALTLGFCLSLTGSMILPVPQQGPPVSVMNPAQAPIFAPVRAPIPTPQESVIIQGLKDIGKKSASSSSSDA